MMAEKQPMSAAPSFPCCSGWSLWQQLTLQNLAWTKPFLNKSPFDCCIDFIQSVLFPSSFTIVTCSVFQSSLCLPCLWPYLAQCITKSQQGQHSIADLVKHVFSAGTLYHSGAHQWKIFSGTFSLMSDCYHTVGLPPSILSLQAGTYPKWKR